MTRHIGFWKDFNGAFTLAEDATHVALPKGCCKNAFTLAEVLITLGIIGIVAALTIPSLVENYKEKVTVNKVKKFYSTLSQAFLLNQNEHGTGDMWEYENLNEYAEKFIKPYFKIIKDCGTKISSKCIYSGTYKLLNGYSWATYSRYYNMVLSDGSTMWFRIGIAGEHDCSMVDGEFHNLCSIFWYDTNGPQPPNVIGKDTFVFYILANNKVALKDAKFCSTASAANQYSWGCAQYILLHGNMNYLKE